MAGTLDYARWRGDLRFKHNKFNSVDGAIFATLAYLPLDSSTIGHTIGETIKEISTTEYYKNLRPKNQVELQLLLKSPRFAKSEILDVQNITKKEPLLQFAAFTARINKRTIIVSYRGTDHSMIGVNEDATMSYTNEIYGQTVAAEYLEKVAKIFPKDHIHVVGHSKGGNYAIYSIANVTPSVQQRIINATSYDGPGYTKQVYDAPGFKKMLPKMKTYIPESSIYGTMLDHPEHTIVVKSTYPMSEQHDPRHWSVSRTSFVLAPGLSIASRALRHSFIHFNKSIPPTARGKMWSALFSALEDQNITNITQLTSNKLIGTLQLSRAYLSLPPKLREIAKQAINDILKATSDQINIPFIDTDLKKFPLSNDSAKAPIFFEYYAAEN